MSAISRNFAARHPSQHVRAMEKAAARRAAMARQQRRAELFRHATGAAVLVSCDAFLLSFCEVIAAPIAGAPLPSIAFPALSAAAAYVSGALFDRAHKLTA